MKLWLDAQLSPSLALWINNNLNGFHARSARDLNLRDAEDEEIFFKARTENAIVMTKDADFARLVTDHGPPPQIIWITAGNTSNARMREIMGQYHAEIIQLLKKGEALIEITGNK